MDSADASCVWMGILRNWKLENWKLESAFVNSSTIKQRGENFGIIRINTTHFMYTSQSILIRDLNHINK
jgi:hypothetical protein